MQLEPPRYTAMGQPAQGEQDGSAQPDDNPVVLEVKRHIGPAREKALDQEIRSDEASHQGAQSMIRAKGNERPPVVVLKGSGIPRAASELSPDRRPPETQPGP